MNHKITKLVVEQYSPAWASHMPLLIKILDISQGSVLELGMGPFSTPLLHTLCAAKNRLLISYENDKNYFASHRDFESALHHIKHIDNWDDANIEHTQWSLAFVDHAPAERRIAEVRRLVDHADYVVIHDSNGRFESRYHYSLIYPLFKYRYEYGALMPHTTVLSNLHDICQIQI